jgi:hypothetical protein
MTMSGLRDLALLSSLGLLLAALCLLAALQLLHPPATRHWIGCSEKWDQEREWVPHVACTAFRPTGR